MSNTKLINIARNFQSSVNIAYDLHDENKIKNFIPTTEALELFEDIFNSINTTSSKILSISAIKWVEIITLAFSLKLESIVSSI